MRIGHTYGLGAGGKYCENRVAGLYGSDAAATTLVERCRVVKDAGIVPTSTTGKGAEEATGTTTTPDWVATYAVGHCSWSTRIDSGIAEPGARGGQQ